jgi:hypothetical protein
VQLGEAIQALCHPHESSPSLLSAHMTYIMPISLGLLESGKS